MAKNMTFKGLAIGSVVALGLTGMVSVPAQAAITDSTKVTLTADSGVGFNVTAVNGATFTVSSTVANSLRGAATTGLKWLVTDPSSALAATFDNDGNNTFANNENAGSVGSAAVDGSFIVDPADFTAELKLTMATATTANYSSTVTAWYDDNGNDVIDIDEYAASQVVNFYLPSSVSSSVVVTSPIIGDTAFEGYVVTSPMLNYAQAALPTVNTNWQGNAGDFAATVSRDSTNERFKFVADRTFDLAITDKAQRAVTTGVATVTAANTLAPGETISISGDIIVTGPLTVATAANGPYTVATASATDFTFDASATGVTAVADLVLTTARTASVRIVAGTYSAQPSVGSNKGTASAFAVGAAVADDGTASAVASSDVKVSGNATAAVAATVRPTVKSVSGQLQFVDVDDVALAAGKPVRLTVGITGATGVKLNGVTKTNGQTLDVVTTAGGVVDFTVTTTSGVATDVVVVTGVAEGVAGTSAAVTYTWTAVTNSFTDLNNSGSSAVRSIAVGGSYTFNFAVADNWAVAPTGDWRIKVAVTGNTVSETYPAMSNGRVSVTVSDAQISTGNVTVVATPQKKSVAGVWEANGANGAVPTAVTYTLIPVAQTGAAVSGAADNAGVLASSTATLVAGDTRTSQAVVTTSGGFTVTGAVTNATTGVARPGALVTVSGPSTILFYKGTEAAYGSISFHADATTGDYTFGAISNIAQKESVVTVSSQGGSKAVKLTFSPALATAGKTVTVDAPASAAPGSTLIVTVKLADKFGNAVRNNDGTNLEANNAVNVTYTGPGLIVGEITNKTDASGEIQFRVLLGQNDSGSAVVTATFQNNTAATTDDVAVTATVVIGTAGNVGALASWTKNLNDGTVKMYAKNIVGAGKVQFMLNGKEIAWVRATSAADSKLRTANGASYLVRTVDLVEGQKNVLEIYVDGVRTTRTAYTY